MKTEIAVIGAGLCGLSVAAHARRRGRDVQVFEARVRPGGRIAALPAGAGAVDLGPSWFWPGQPRMAALVEALGLTAFEQHAAGDAVFEAAGGALHRAAGLASMAGSLRVAGGVTRIVEALAAQLGPERLHLGAPVQGVSREGGVELADGRRCAAERIVLALPPRIAAGLAFAPALDPGLRRALEAVPTWMAGHAKFVAVYPEPFWRAEGLSGDAVSRRGPLAEIHDASGPEGAPAALFGFLGLPAAERARDPAAVEAAALAQLGRIFGAWALDPLDRRLKDWAQAPETARPPDRTPPPGHPRYGLPPDLTRLWDGRLLLAGAESALEMGGLMEGALAAAEATAARL